MKQPYQIGIDVWEGQLEIDEAVLKANGVKFMFVRLNNMDGGHHKDENFDKQWNEAAGFYRAPYFVYNPWVSAQKNFDWLSANMPVNAQLVSLDIEVKYTGISAAAYAAAVAEFRTLVNAKWRSVIYTGEWFLPYLSTWPVGDYWWAQYPLTLYPTTTTTITWDQFRSKLEPFEGPMNALRCPGDVVIWQCSGDRFILPGTTRRLDLNVFFGDEQQLAALFGALPDTLDVAPVLHKLDLFEAVLQSDMAERLAEWSSLLDEIRADVNALKGDQVPAPTEPPVDPIPEEPPLTDPVYPGYTGVTVGVYRVRQTIEKDPANGSEYVNARGAKLRTAPDFAAGEAQFALRDEQERFLLALNGGNLQPLFDRGFLKDGNQFKQLFQFAFPGQMLVVLDKKKVGELVWGKILVISKDSTRGDNRYPLDAKWTNEQRTNWLVHVRIQNDKKMVIPFFDPKEAHGDLSFLWIPMGALEKV